MDPIDGPMTEHEFNHDGLRYQCVRGMIAPAIGHEDGIPRMADWSVSRSDGDSRVVPHPVDPEFDAAGLEAATLRAFRG